MTRSPMTPLDPSKTVRHRSFRGGRAEVWGAVSADGRWSYRRLEVTGTPWIVCDTNGTEWGGTWHGTLGSARRATFRHDTTVKEVAR